MTLALKTKSSIYQVSDPGGWRFRIETDHTEQEGWSARAVIFVEGLKEERPAIEHLRPALRALLRQLDAEFDEPGAHE
jgi:hypothetical protein